ncbi:IclR helix-turn-helix domain-containing protein [Natronorubrum daqingense]|uniref:IclR helix-turn-helix domain-containing protein n=1 Tax=Natronorubrum daqingense TaxID=588898 RepID=A0A1N6YIX3_9EURY|nr:helix-turn-helix domain-containing protein [Natronorubrum daqingense]APX95651.1 MarR family transcriptional regulator [Natronorubrum daqingense]SIR14544.1 IclR helix-turn-helix domain-containing protein [Natronorubrum daqingense]
MVQPSQIGVTPAIDALYSSVSAGTIPTSIRRFDSQSDISTVTSVGEHVSEPLTSVALLRGSSLWEVAMIVVLFVLISGLVGIRLREIISRRDVDLASNSLLAESTTDSKASARSPTDDQQPYEQYLSPETPVELLSDKGEVVRLLVANHGRIRQHQIAEETGWSKSKVSRICSQMHTDGTIEKTSVGRENVITLADQSPDSESHTGDPTSPLQ